MPLPDAIEQKYLKMLRRRKDYLERRISAAEPGRNDLSYDREEIAALKWAIYELGHKYEQADLQGQGNSGLRS